MSEMTAIPSLTSALMPPSAPALRPATVADGKAGNAAEKIQAAAADDKDPGPDAVAAQGADVSPFAAIMQRHLAPAATKTDAAPAKKAAVVEDGAPDPAAGLAGLLPLIQSLAPNTAGQPGPNAEKTTVKQGSASVVDLSAPVVDLSAPVVDLSAPIVELFAAPVADLSAAPVKTAALAEDTGPDPVAASLATVLPMLQSLATNKAGQPGLDAVSKRRQGAEPVAGLAAAPVKKTAATADIAADPATASQAAIQSMIQSLAPNKAGQPELGAASEKRQGLAPSAPRLVEGAAPIQASMGGGAAATETLAATASPGDKAAITAALSAPTGDFAAGDARHVDSSTPDGTFENLLAAAQVSIQTHPGDVRGSAPLHVETPVGAHGWNDNVGEKLVWMVGRQEQRAELVLNPPQLGRVEVSLSMNGDQVNAQFVSANPAVREALEAALPRLREMLADAGVSLGQGQVGSESANNAANQSANRQENRDNQSRASGGLSDLRQMSASAPWLRQGNGMVDVFA